MKYVIVSGGVLSGLGKGVSASSIGVLLKSAGLRVTAIKCDPYVNIDPGTMSPFEHGEVFVLDDGGEVDLDLGNYERFLDVCLTRENNITTGKVYDNVIRKERKGDYLGKTVQVIPHITNEIQEWIERVAHIPSDGNGKVPDACVIELGGTVGDIESAPFIEALRQFQFRVGQENVFFVHVSLIPVMGPVGEQKTKPTQNTVKDLRGLGITPDMLICRSKNPLVEETRQKISAFCHVPPGAVVSAHDVSNIYQVPIMLDAQGVTQILSERLGFELPPKRPVLEDWKKLADHVDSLEEADEVHIAVAGKYTDLSDAYLSVIKALQHSSFEVSRKLVIDWIESSDLDDEAAEAKPDAHAGAWRELRAADGVLVPGGFGIRGIEGKIKAAEYARENGVPYLGVCLGLQVATIEFCRNVLGLEGANSTEFEEDTPNPAVVFMPEISKTHMGGTMRLGTKPTPFLVDDCKIRRLYGGADHVDERHRHRYEVNPDLIEQIESAGLKYVGKDETGERCEIMELGGHPYFVGTQYHPEFKSRPGKPSPPYLGLLKASVGMEV
ncbi:MAG: CTP synthase (glutamine hydrolyzing) [Candidatus Thalassarchaeaceae archaeon]|jgi:CTP synthase|nr:CTP synthetase [Euryarchaeota archaeon]MDP6220151.1 CTP synthase (glutamine hydrolyzing) [Candidatus Thalassarchaeaceae archaeon]MDP7091799.1 CTP synthase (glutamine hydrolyzing) [Candidatus Thalassarchaeaceae archaeon]MDP7257362.1 CTP synthase (glutamine hydrolyzing) [Candidatus Thalassarchaeaceae archaeon]MDP7446716.1 CTP synthase (glutamine hydrolyzing) [Candidatus Thalassarchaeaceae archaeon]|tara:strand:+ start:23564 stop:25225 length:1662 start_codon:yes stop_codon:yes gene_type:complete